MEITFTPSGFTAEDSDFEGTITMRVPSMIEKYKYLAEVGLDLDALKEVGAKTLTALGPIVALLEKLKPHFVAVAIKKKADGKEIKSFDEMIYEPGLEPVLFEIAGKVLGGVPLGQSSKAK